MTAKAGIQRSLKCLDSGSCYFSLRLIHLWRNRGQLGRNDVRIMPCI